MIEPAVSSERKEQLRALDDDLAAARAHRIELARRRDELSETETQSQSLVAELDEKLKADGGAALFKLACGKKSPETQGLMDRKSYAEHAISAARNGLVALDSEIDAADGELARLESKRDSVVADTLADSTSLLLAAYKSKIDEVMQAATDLQALVDTLKRIGAPCHLELSDVEFSLPSFNADGLKDHPGQYQPAITLRMHGGKVYEAEKELLKFLAGIRAPLPAESEAEVPVEDRAEPFEADSVENTESTK